MGKEKENPYPDNYGKTWLIEDMWTLVEMYDQKVTWTSIAQKLQRTVSACKSRLYVIRLAFLFSSGKEGDTIMNSIVKLDTRKELSKSIEYLIVDKNYMVMHGSYDTFEKASIKFTEKRFDPNLFKIISKETVTREEELDDLLQIEKKE